MSRSRASSSASLPTPPTSIRKRARSESDDENESQVEQVAHKRQRLCCTPQRSFGRPTCHGLVLEGDHGPALPSPPSSDPAPLPTGSSPCSDTCLITPQTSHLCALPIRDTPHNVFLASHSATEQEDTSQNFGVTDPRGERPVMAYLFRGARKIFANPFYGCMTDPRSKLDPCHPDFSPAELYSPKRLFCCSESHAGASMTTDQSDSEYEADEPARYTLIPRSLEDAFRRVAGVEEEDNLSDNGDWGYEEQERDGVEADEDEDEGYEHQDGSIHEAMLEDDVEADDESQEEHQLLGLPPTTS
ncbi:hypothetical protein PENSPDRAFT_654475 [Peniophora sp. CONT]|nr:hypothetical protein PENSPDRAFT_654475 [Peniophora sp. CONT]